MVLNDPFGGHSRTSPTPGKSGPRELSPHYALASPTDRLAAVVVDYVLLIPLLSLALAPLKRVFLVGQLLGQDFYYHFELLFAFLIVATVCVLYQTLFVYYKGATPGKMLLKLHVVSIWPGRPVSLLESAVRATLWWLEALLLFIPHMAVWGGHRRRPAHDRLADTVVITHRWRAVSEPTVAEASFARGMMHAGVLLVLSFVAANVVELVNEPDEVPTHRTVTQVNPSDCTLDEDIAQGPADPNGVSQLQSQMALFAVGQTTPECLQLRADRVLTHDPENAMAYLAKAFAFASDPEKSDDYLQEVCTADLTSESCQFSHVVEAWNEGDWKGPSQSLLTMLPHAPEFIRLWAVRHFFRTRDYRHALAVLERAPIAQAYAEFVLSYRVKALWYTGDQNGARAVYRVHLQHLDLTSKLDSSAWLCREELRSSGCPAVRSQGCQHFLGLSDGREEQLLTTAPLALTDIQIKTCRDGENFNYQSEYFEKFPDQAQEYVQALEFIHNGKVDQANELLRELSTSDEITPITVEASLRLLKSQRISPLDMDAVYGTWREQDPFQMGWNEIGQVLMDRYAAIGEYDHSFRVGKMLSKSTLDNSRLQNRLADLRQASLAHRQPRVQSRAPASEEEP